MIPLEGADGLQCLQTLATERALTAAVVLPCDAAPASATHGPSAQVPSGVRLPLAAAGEDQQMQAAGVHDNTIMVDGVLMLSAEVNATRAEVLRCMQAHPRLCGQRTAAKGASHPATCLVKGVRVELAALHNAVREVADNENLTGSQVKDLVGAPLNPPLCVGPGVGLGPSPCILAQAQAQAQALGAAAWH